MASEDFEKFVFLQKDFLDSFQKKVDQEYEKEFHEIYKDFVRDIGVELLEAKIKGINVLKVRVLKRRTFKSYRWGFCGVTFRNDVGVSFMERRSTFSPTSSCYDKMVNMAVDMFAASHSLVENSVDLTVEIGEDEAFPETKFTLTFVLDEIPE